MTDSTFCATFFDNFFNTLPAELRGVKDTLKQHLHATVQNTLAEFDFVPRDEFDAMSAVLQRCREKITALEQQLDTLDQQTASPD